MIGGAVPLKIHKFVTERGIFFFPRKNELDSQPTKAKKDAVADAADTWLFASVSSQPSTGLVAYSTCLDIEKQAVIHEEAKTEVKIELIPGIESA